MTPQPIDLAALRLVANNQLNRRKCNGKEGRTQH